MEDNSLDSQPRGATDSASNAMSNQNHGNEALMDGEDLDAWNPMAEDYSNKAFNDYSQPTTEELRKWMPRKGEQKAPEDLMACYRSDDGDVRLFINGIPPDLKQEGIRGLFSQAGKVCYCKVIPLRDPNKNNTFGFVGYNSYREAERAIRNFDGFSIGNDMKLRVSLSKKKNKFHDSPLPDSNMMAAIPSGVVNGEAEDEGRDWDAELALAMGDSTVDMEGGTVAMGNSVPMGDNTVAKDDSAVAMGVGNVASSDSSTVQENHTDVPVTSTEIPTHSDQVRTSGVDMSINGHVVQASSSNGPVVNGIDSKTSSAQNLKSEIPEGPCTVCGKLGRKRCLSCKVPYCSAQCQRADWPEHKQQCSWRKQEEAAKRNKESYLVDEDELEITGILGFAKTMFNLEPRPDMVLRDEVPPESNRYLEDQDSHYGYAQPLDSARETAAITEITSEDEQLLNDEPETPLISEITSEDEQLLHDKPETPLITEINSEETPVLSTERDETIITDNIQSAPMPLISDVSAGESTQNKPFDNREESKVSLSSRCIDNSAVGEDITTPKEQEEGSKITEIQHATNTNSINLTNQSSAQQNCEKEDSPHSNKKPDEVVGYPRYRITDVPLETMSIRGWYDIVVTSLSSPTMFWAQLFQEDTLAKQNYLLDSLDTLYTGPAPKPYVPTPSDVCVTQYTKDNNWYRCKVDYINNNGLIAVTHIDFGSTEDVDPSRIRRITSELVSVPRQALKCSLYLPTTNKVSWSPETVGDFGAKVLDVKCRAEVKEVRDSVFHLDVYDSNRVLINVMFAEGKVIEPASDTNQVTLVDALAGLKTQDTHPPSGITTEDYPLPAASEVVQSPSPVEMMAAPPQEPEHTLTAPCVPHVPPTEQVQERQQDPMQPLSPSPTVTLPTEKQENTLTSPGVPIVPVVPHVPHVPPKEVAQPREQAQVQPSSPILTTTSPPQKQENTLTSPSVHHVPDVPLSEQTPAQPSPPRPTAPSPVVTSPPSGILSSSSSEADLSTKSPLPSTPQPGHFIHKTKFEGVVSSVVSPREFKVVLTDPALLEKLEVLSNQLNSHCAGTPHDPSASYEYNDICAVKSRTDKEWYRGRVLFNCHQGNYSIQLMDIDNKEFASSQNMRHIPDWFKSLPHRSVMCSLGGVTKRAGTTIFGRDAVDKFRSLALNKKFMFQEISRFKNTYIVEVLDESGQPSVAREMIDAGLADAYCKKVRSPVHSDRNEDNAVMNPSILLTYKVAITTAKLPPPGQVFQITPTEYESPTLFYIHLNDSQQKLEKICKEMNQYYGNMPVPSDWQARQRQLCAAVFKGSWLRAFIQDINADNVVTIIGVDFGNVEVVSTSALRPLAPQFSNLPYCALRCSLANIIPAVGKEWSKDAVDFVRMKMPLSSTLNASLIYKGQTILFIDVFLPNKENLCQLLTTKKLALSNHKRESRYPGSPPKETRFNQPKFMEERSPHSRQHRSQEREAPPSPRMSAIQSANLPLKETFKAFATNIESPGCFSIQVADYDMVSKVAALHKDMSTHYNSTQYPPYQPVPNQLCAAQFTMEENSWFRGWIERIEEGKAYVYYPDYGNSELVDASNLRPLEAQFSTLPFAALSCSLGSIIVEGDWSQEALALFKDKIRLYEAFDAKMVYRRRDCIYLDIVDPQDPGTTLSKALVARNLAGWLNENRKPGVDPAMNQRRVFKPVADYQPNYMPTDARESPPNLETQETGINDLAVENCQEDNNETTDKNFQEKTSDIPVKKYFLESLPLITVSSGVFHNAMVCDIKKNGVISLQMLTKDLEELVSLGTNVGNHCNDVDHTQYSPVAGELCLARFSADKEWYRVVVDEVLPDDQVKVTFLDYGNEDMMSYQDVRRMDDKFLYLPRQAYNGTLKGLTSLPSDVLSALKSRLLEKRIFARVDDNAIEFFDVGPDDKPSNSVNEDVLEVLYPRLNLPKDIDTEFAGRATEVHGTGEIWIQYQLEHDVITALMGDVKAFCESSGASPVTSLPSPGELLFAKHSFYGNWYRVKVLECKSPQSVQVVFVDYGYNEEVPLDKLCRGKPELMRTSFLAVKCFLVRVIQGKTDADDFVKQILDRVFKAKICEKRGEEFGVELEDYDVPGGPLNINDYLIGFGYQA